MSYSASVTVTGVVGPGNTVTAQVYSAVSSFTIDVANSNITINQSGKITNIALATTGAVTVTRTAGDWTVTIA